MSTIEREASVTMSASIRDNHCQPSCAVAPWVTYYEGGKLVRTSSAHHERGDVRRCEHGRIWFCEGRFARNGYRVSGYWTELHPVWNCLRYRRAARALGKVSA